MGSHHRRAGRRTLLGWTAGACALTALEGWSLRVPEVDAADRWLFTVVDSAPEFLRGPLWAAQSTGVLGAPAVVAAGAAAVRRYRLAVALLLLIPSKLAAEHELLKSWVTHPRPGALVPSAILRGAPVAGNAFPSGHAVILAGMAVLLLPWLGMRGRAAVLAVAVLGALARVYLGAHTPLDVLGGAAAGVALGTALTLLTRAAPRVPIVPTTGDQQPSLRTGDDVTVQE
ncbi:phosphatase PAP2 family protein [Nocardia farcinica]|uniref:phosphatase PAP2 family protein n=1 Tax=Nocardia farcinica TaxID=37329 RepID=UPI001893C89F|nr:phosphatase PAP2 family protein [Nocardia farcinica]MBF6235020.1 phosphatase PAP2 family protein [Nocardia farcinica]MBF6445327.1 phosphatase PAP2 family protein [Nocardia farcinica]